MPPIHPAWDGICLGTIRVSEDTADDGDLFKNWSPLIAIIALPSTILRKERKALWNEFENEGYTKMDIKCRHADFGGVTHAAWHFMHLSRPPKGCMNTQAIMMTPQFRRSLQTALDDTQGHVKGGAVVFEKD